MIELTHILPALIILVASLILMFLSMYDRFIIKHHITVTYLFLILALAVSNYYLYDSYSYIPYSQFFYDLLIFDSFSNFFNLTLITGTLLVVLIGESYANNKNYMKGEFYSLILFALFGMMLFANSNELITAFIALEIASFSVYILVGFNSSNPKRIEAIFKYLVLGAFMGAFYLLGTVLIFGATGSTQLLEIAQFIATKTASELALVYIGVTLILFTFLFKIAAFPFQSWVLDVYRGAPILVTAFMASVFKIAIFSFFLRMFLTTIPSMQSFWEPILTILIILTLTIGTWLALNQNIIKRMLAGSSIVHTGYLLLGFIAIDENIQSANSILFYLLAYLLTSIGAFGLISHIISEGKSRVTYDDFKGLAQERPFIAAMMTIFLFSLAGIPSTIGFIAKFYIFAEAISAGYIYLAIYAILATCVSIYYYFKLIAMMYFYPKQSQFKNENFNDYRVSTYITGVVAIMILWGGIGSAILFFLPVPSIDALFNLVKISIESLFISN